VKGYQGWRAGSVNTLLPFAVWTLEQISTVVEIRVSSPVRRCGYEGSNARKNARWINRCNPAGISSAVVSNLERRTTTLGQLFPVLKFVSSVGCLHKLKGGEARVAPSRVR
jgi:hypothetical protein